MLRAAQHPATMGTSNVDYCHTLYETATLPKHTGEPNFEIIQSLHSLLNTNASDVLTSLGGANHGYLGLLLSDAAYALFLPRLLFGLSILVSLSSHMELLYT